MNLNKFEITKDKVMQLKPIVEKILSRKYGKEIRFENLTVGSITVGDQEGENKSAS
jgi:hypothetical protein